MGEQKTRLLPAPRRRREQDFYRLLLRRTLWTLKAYNSSTIMCIRWCRAQSTSRRMVLGL